MLLYDLTRTARSASAMTIITGHTHDQGKATKLVQQLGTTMHVCTGGLWWPLRPRRLPDANPPMGRYILLTSETVWVDCFPNVHVLSENCWDIVQQLR
jgi:hypothetical protein